MAGDFSRFNDDRVVGLKDSSQILDRLGKVASQLAEIRSRVTGLESQIGKAAPTDVEPTNRSNVGNTLSPLPAVTLIGLLEDAERDTYNVLSRLTYLGGQF